MGYEDSFDLDVAKLSDLEDLDRVAADAQKRLDKSAKDYEKVKKTTAQADSKEQKEYMKIQKKIEKLEKKIEGKQDKKAEKELAAVQKLRDKADLQKQRFEEKLQDRIEKRKRVLENAKKRDNDRTYLQKLFGGGISSSPKVALKLFQNPVGFIFSALHLIPLLGGVLAAVDIAKFVWEELARIDEFLKKFRDIADDRVNVFLDRQEEALVRSGLSQRISTTQAGIIDPREAYNTLEEFETNREDLENKYATRDTSGT